MTTYTGWFKRLGAAVILGGLLLGLSGALLARSAVPHLGYGFNVTSDGQAPSLSTMNFNWMKLFDVPSAPVAAQSILLRVDVTSSLPISDLQLDLDNKLNYLQLNGISVAAWEIGNEPNIDANYGWGANPNVADYKDRLCAAYAKIKGQLPDAIVVSAGLAPVGRLTDSHQIDDREFIQQLLDMGGGACLDAVGYHPYGYSADYDAAPDVVSTDPTQNCDQGLCFRGAEKIYEIMQAHGAGDKKLWATEFGWITQPPDYCLSDPSWSGREWQIVSENKQASNLVGAFQYADEHWPWMGAMFVFNYDFNQNAGLAECDQMRFYAVQGRPAEGALKTMTKNPASFSGRLKTDTTAIQWLVGVNEQPLTLTANIDLANWGWQSLVYTATVDNSASLVPMIDLPTGTLSGTAQTYLNVSLPAFTHTLGTYTGTLTVNWYATGAGNNPRQVALQVDVVPEVFRTYLPLAAK